MNTQPERLRESAKLHEEEAEVMKTVPKRTYESGVVLSKDSLDALEQLGIVLKTIYIQMQKEGYRIVDGKMMNINENKQKEENRSRDLKRYSQR